MDQVWQIFYMRPNMWDSVDLKLLSHFAALQSFKRQISKSGWLVKKHVRCIKFSSHFVKKNSHPHGQLAVLLMFDSEKYFKDSRIQGLLLSLYKAQRNYFKQLLVEHYTNRENGEVWRIEIMTVKPSQYFIKCLQHGWCTCMYVL